jgi:hypothetical protein
MSSKDGRVAGMASKCDKDTGSNPISGMFCKRNMDRDLNPSTVLLTENAKSILGSALLAPICHNRQGERGRNINLRTSVQRILLLLDMAATLPVTTHVVTGRVADMSSKCDKDTGSNPISGMFGERNMDRGLNPSTVLPTENAKSILESMLLAPNCHDSQGEWGRNINLRISVQRVLLFARHGGHSASHYMCSDWQSGRHV